MFVFSCDGFETVYPLSSVKLALSVRRYATLVYAAMSDSVPDLALGELPTFRRARNVLGAFVLTFLLTRVIVLLIMTRRLPDLFLHLGQTHVHHLNYGILLLCIVAGWSLFVPLRGQVLQMALLLYGIALALTFDEFGMWLHLGGGYWQRASYDAVVIVSSLLALLSFAPSLKRFHARHWSVLVTILITFGLFVWLLIERVNRFGTSMGPWLEQLELNSPR